MSADASSQPADASSKLSEFFVFLAELIQLYAFNENPSILMLTSSSGERGSIAIADGRVTHAQVGPMIGVEALHHILCWKKGELTQRTIDRASITSITTDLATTLMNAYDYMLVYDGHADDLEAQSHLKLTSSTFDSRDAEWVNKTPTKSNDTHQHFFQLVRDESLRNEIRAIEGFVSLQLLDLDGQCQLNSALVEIPTMPLARHMFDALEKSNALDEHLELYLTLSASYHTFLRLPAGEHILYTVFTLEETSPAMVQFQLKQIIEKLAHPPSSAQS